MGVGRFREHARQLRPNSRRDANGQGKPRSRAGLRVDVHKDVAENHGRFLASFGSRLSDGPSRINEAEREDARARRFVAVT
jgi:hypothetical protein